MKRILKKAMVISLGLLSILLILELSLRIAGFLFLNSNHPAYNKKYQNKDVSIYTILCLGDSHTYGMGVTNRYNYPSQLEVLLNNRRLTTESRLKTFKVINKGVVTQNTVELLISLKKTLDEVKPDLVILLTGGANNWNYYGYKPGNSNPELSGFLNNALYKIRVYKLVVLLYKNITVKLTQRSQEANNSINPTTVSQEGNNKKEISQEENILNIKYKIKQFEEKIKLETNNPENYFYAGLYYYQSGNIEQARKLFELGIDVDPSYGNNYALINYCYTYHSNNIEQAIKWLKEKIVKYPNNPLLYEMLAEDYHKLGFREESTKWLTLAKNLGPNAMRINYKRIDKSSYNFLERRAMSIDPRFKDINDGPHGTALGFITFQEGIDKEKIVNDNMNYVLPWVKADLENIINICRKNKVEIIIQNYAIKPEYGFWTQSARTVNVVLKEVANEYSIPFVDNEENFNSLGENQKYYFNHSKDDSHPNEKGYGLMAKNLYYSIVTNYLGE
jgi:lysophospholipase L1-like esterase